jgi:pilus assembly protein CpaC
MMRWLPVAVAVLVASPAVAQAPVELGLSIGQGVLLQLDRPAATVFVADPETADVQIAGPQSIFVFGQRSGRTTLFALDAGGAPILRREITVAHDLTRLRSILSRSFPGSRIAVSSGPRSVLIEGSAASPQEAEAIAKVVQGAVGEGEKIINRLAISAPTQVNLRVRVAEVSRNVDDRLGINWRAMFNVGEFTFNLFTGRPLAAAGTLLEESFGLVGGSLVNGSGDYDINVLIDALNREGLARTLAEPNLTAISGETASFTAGGEFPIPVAQDNDSVTIEFKPFGVILDFTPTVLTPDRISLRVRPEVSDLTNQGAIEINGFRIPAITVRRVETTVELASGQSLVIGGLLQQTTRDAVDKVPGLGTIPVLGALFTSSRYQNNETELIVTVTPYIVRPTRPDALPTPVGLPPAGQSLESLLLGRATRRGPPPGRLHGPVGFVY